MHLAHAPTGGGPLGEVQISTRDPQPLREARAGNTSPIGAGAMAVAGAAVGIRPAARMPAGERS